ncbi:MAG: transglutaminase-like domain-containing protein [Lachnospirales bacterium]
MNTFLNFPLKFSIEEKLKIERDFEKVHSMAKGRKKELFSVLEGLDEIEELCLKFMFAYMPPSDLGFYNGDIFLNSMRSSLKALYTLPWAKDISTEHFLNYVLTLRLNNEDLTNNREIFFKELYPRVKDMDIKSAALEINYWCFEKATYQSTDIRTVSPLTIIKSAYGRCGEESVLLVSALRSMCIPARQCYTPRWSHCDDNHAWVEVFINGVWHFMGACEPEPIIDTGWFVQSAKRAMLVRARSFSHGVNENTMTSENSMIQINCTENYTETKLLEVYVYKNKSHLEGSNISFQVINFSEAYGIYETTTDSHGKSEILTGLGDILVHVSYKDTYICKKIDMRKYTMPLYFNVEDFKTTESKPYKIRMVPPSKVSISSPTLSGEEKTNHDEKLKKCIEIRTSYESTFLKEEKAEEAAKEYPKEFQKDIAHFFQISNGNWQEIEIFIKDSKYIKEKIEMLKTLKIKDFSDTTAKVLNAHFNDTIKYKGLFNDNIFYKYILCPRVSWEFITEWRSFIANYFTPEEIGIFKKNPKEIYLYIKKNIKDITKKDYSTIFASPKGILQLGYGSINSMKILFVAICRTFAIPAFINEIDGNLEYMSENKFEKINFTNVEKVEKSSRLKIINSSSTKLEYFKNITIGKLIKGKYKTLNFETMEEFSLEAGDYRVITSNRQIDGTVLCNFYFIHLEENEANELKVTIPTPDEEENTETLKLPKAICAIEQILPLVMEKNIIAWLDPGKEPTEHLLNEILEKSREFKKYSNNISFILKDKKDCENKTFLRALKEVNFNYYFIDEKMDILKNLKKEKILFPFVLAIKNKECLFYSEGYNVSLGDRLLNFLK